MRRTIAVTGIATSPLLSSPRHIAMPLVTPLRHRGLILSLLPASLLPLTLCLLDELISTHTRLLTASLFIFSIFGARATFGALAVHTPLPYGGGRSGKTPEARTHLLWTRLTVERLSCAVPALGATACALRLLDRSVCRRDTASRSWRLPLHRRYLATREHHLSLSCCPRRYNAMNAFRALTSHAGPHASLRGALHADCTSRSVRRRLSLRATPLGPGRSRLDQAAARNSRLSCWKTHAILFTRDDAPLGTTSPLQVPRYSCTDASRGWTWRPLHLV